MRVWDASFATKTKVTKTKTKAAALKIM